MNQEIFLHPRCAAHAVPQQSYNILALRQGCQEQPSQEVSCRKQRGQALHARERWGVPVVNFANVLEEGEEWQ